ncbi:response regulator [Pedobacter fastidiosus]|uniref:Response regulator n=1 Tax=Pedobacter fastidiosus TaxID=2765361 RepID=A0ABR7KYL4_9SPHI|nr:response regulator [Pedobacter fastidiosus]MBC6113187.1 response regulator [Pedobacter fastidiosus]
MIIDDDDTALFLHETILGDCGTTRLPESFNSAQSALEYLNRAENQAAQYLILLDINMPVMNGWEFLDALETATANRNIQVVMVTSSIEERDKKRALSKNLVTDFLIKPLTEQQLGVLKQYEHLQPFFE